MSDLFEETKQDYNYSRKVELYRKAFPVIIATTFLLILAIVAKNWYQDRQDEKKIQETAILVESVLKSQDENFKKEALTSLLTSNNYIGDLARLELSAESALKLRDVAALAGLEKSIEDSKDIVAKNLLKILYAAIAIDLPNDDQNIQQKTMSYLKSIDNIQPLYHNAQIYLSLYYIKYADLASASATILQLKSMQISESIRAQLEAIESYLRNQGVK